MDNVVDLNKKREAKNSQTELKQSGQGRAKKPEPRLPEAFSKERLGRLQAEVARQEKLNACAWYCRRFDRQTLTAVLAAAGVRIDLFWQDDHQSPAQAADLTLEVWVGQPPGQLDEKLHKTFARLVEKADALYGDRKFKELRRFCLTEDAKMYETMSLASWFQAEGRVHFARALSTCADKQDRKRGVQMLIQHLKRNPGTRPGPGLIDAAARLAAEANDRFLQIFRQAGGTIAEIEAARFELIGRGAIKVAPASGPDAPAAPEHEGAASAQESGNSSQNVLPLPGVLVTPTEPP